MITNPKSKTLVGLDIDAGSIAATEVHVNGGVEVKQTALASLGSGVFHEGEVLDAEALGDALGSLFSDCKLDKHVRLGLANQRVAVRTVSLPVIEDAKELDTAIRFQAQEHVPMPLDQAVLDYDVAEKSIGPDGERRMLVVVVAARRDMVQRMLAALHQAGLRPAGLDLSAFGMIRALSGSSPSTDRPPAALPEDASELPIPARLYCNLADVTNLAVARGTSCLFTRVSSYGVEGMAQRLAERRRLTLEHARQWLVHVGLERPLGEVDGDQQIISAAREVLEEGVGKLADELRMSLEFYAAQESALRVEGAVACGPGSTIPGLLDRLGAELGHSFEPGRPVALAGMDDAAAARLALPFGLALEE